MQTRKLLLRCHTTGRPLVNSCNQQCINQPLRNVHRFDRKLPIKYPEKSLYPKKHLYDPESHKQYSKAMAFLKSKKRKGTGVFVENVKMIYDLVNQGQRPSHIFYVKAETLEKIADLDEETEKIQITEKQMARLTDVAAPQGLMAVFSRPAKNVSRDDAIPLIIYLDQVKSPGNVGTIIRSAAGAACTSVVTSPNSADIWAPATIRASAASHFLIPLHQRMKFDKLVGSLPKNWNICLVESACGNVPQGSTKIQSKPYYEVDFTQPTVMVFGTEAGGLSTHVREQAVRHGVHNVITAHIPTIAELDSLNVGMAATVLIYEMARQQKHISKEKDIIVKLIDPSEVNVNLNLMSNEGVVSDLAEDLKTLFPAQTEIIEEG